MFTHLKGYMHRLKSEQAVAFLQIVNIVHLLFRDLIHSIYFLFLSSQQ